MDDMKSSTSLRIVLVTVPDLAIARSLAGNLLGKRLIACANFVPGLESIYFWQGRIESSAEVQMVLKTTRALLPEVESAIRQDHPYDTPEILALTPSEGSVRYMDWLRASVKSKNQGKLKSKAGPSSRRRG